MSSENHHCGKFCSFKLIINRKMPQIILKINDWVLNANTKMTSQKGSLQSFLRKQRKTYISYATTVSWSIMSCGRGLSQPIVRLLKLSLLRKNDAPPTSSSTGQSLVIWVIVGGASYETSRGVPL